MTDDWTFGLDLWCVFTVMCLKSAEKIRLNNGLNIKQRGFCQHGKWGFKSFLVGGYNVTNGRCIVICE